MQEKIQLQNSSKRHYLIIGAGCVGQVLGAHLHEGGAKVTFFSKPKYKKTLEEEGIQIVNWKNKSNCFLSDPHGVTHIDKVLPNEYFAVFICVRSEQLPSLTELLTQFPKEWPLVCFQPGFQDIKILSESLPGRTILHGHPGFSAYVEKPLIYNDTNKFNPTLISAYPPEHSPLLNPLTQQVVHDLLAGKLPARVSTNVAQEVHFLYAYGICLLLGMKYHGWHIISLLYDSRLFSFLQNAAKEAVLVLKKVYGVEPPWWQRLWFKLPMGLSRSIMQFHMATPDAFSFHMWTKHAPKIQKQTLNMANEIRQMAREHHLPTPHFEKMMDLIEGLNRESEKRQIKETLSVIQGKNG